MVNTSVNSYPSFLAQIPFSEARGAFWWLEVRWHHEVFW